MANAEWANANANERSERATRTERAGAAARERACRGVRGAKPLGSHVIIAALLGILQGLTEFLPVSSTAHLLLGAHALGFDDPGGVFTVLIQLGSILAVMWLYRAKLLHVAAGLPSDPDARRFVLMIVIAFLPAVVAGLLFAGFVKRVLYETPSVIAISFIAG